MLPTVWQHSITLLWAWEVSSERPCPITYLICDTFSLLILLPSLIYSLSLLTPSFFNSLPLNFLSYLILRSHFHAPNLFLHLSKWWLPSFYFSAPSLCTSVATAIILTWLPPPFCVHFITQLPTLIYIHSQFPSSSYTSRFPSSDYIFSFFCLPC